MAAAAAVTDFRAMLGRCGFSNDAVTAIEADGFNSADEICLGTETGFRTMIKVFRERKPVGRGPTATNQPVVISGRAEQCFYALLLWLKQMSAQDRSIVPAEFTDTVLKTYRILYRDKKDSESIESSSYVSKPAKFTEKTRFPQWFRAFENWLGAQKGDMDVPMLYVLRAESTPLTGTDLANLSTIHAREIAGTHHTGPAFEADNGKVFDVIEDLTADGPAWNWVKKFKKDRDGRGAVFGMKAYYKGDAWRNKEVNSAHSGLDNGRYDREKQHNTFEHFANRQLDLYSILEENGEPIPAQKQIRDFLKRITATEMAAGKAAIAAAPGATFPTLETVVTFLSHFVSTINPGRGIAGAGRGGGRGRGGRGARFGRGGGRGGGGRGGRGGRGSGGGGDIAARNYTSEEWGKLSKEQQEKVRELRLAKKRNASAVTTGTGGDKNAAPDAGGDAGNSFSQKKGKGE